MDAVPGLVEALNDLVASPSGLREKDGRWRDLFNGKDLSGWPR